MSFLRLESSPMAIMDSLPSPLIEHHGSMLLGYEVDILLLAVRN